MQVEAGHRGRHLEAREQPDRLQHLLRVDPAALLLGEHVHAWVRDRDSVRGRDRDGDRVEARDRARDRDGDKGVWLSPCRALHIYVYACALAVELLEGGDHRAW